MIISGCAFLFSKAGLSETLSTTHRVNGPSACSRAGDGVQAMAVDGQPASSGDIAMDATDSPQTAAAAAQDAVHQPIAVTDLPPKLQQLAANWPSSQQRLAEFLAMRPHDRPPDTANATIFSYGGECAVCQQRTQPLFAVVRIAICQLTCQTYRHLSS